LRGASCAEIRVAVAVWTLMGCLLD